MKHRCSSSLLAVFGVFSIMLTGCAYTPHDGDQITQDTAYFIGFATAPSSSVRVQARRFWDGSWVTIATVVADRSAYGTSAPTFEQDVYQWDVNVRVPSYLFDPSGRVRLRAQQAVGVSWVPMFMYDNAGWQCLIGRYLAAGSGELDVWNAGIECSQTSGTSRHEIMLHR
jgi:hypothetical protein